MKFWHKLSSKGSTLSIPSIILEERSAGVSDAGKMALFPMPIIHTEPSYPEHIINLRR